ncbi:hypothetical protein [Streptomyces sp. NPDC050982]|uniref:hypothetical protein n=1 Tax=Streptomyces sp. NPDC050982 TaxID=3154746 RepID=UPI0033DD313B
MEPGTSTHIESTHEDTRSGDGVVVLPGVRLPQGNTGGAPEATDPESHIIRGED